MNAAPIFLYQAYGSWKFRQQAKLGILSLFSHSVPPENVVGFTDRPEEFRELQVVAWPASAQQIKQWCGPCGFHHRLKIELIRAARRRFAARPVIYVDSDTIWLSSPAAVVQAMAAGKVVFHDREARLSSTFFPEYLQALRLGGYFRDEQMMHDGKSNIFVHNAGIVGLPPSISDDLLDEVLRLCDFLVRQVPQKMEWVEQLAFSYVMARATSIQTCAADVLHYWRDSAVFTRAIKDYTIEQLFNLCCDHEALNHLLSAERDAKRSFANQLVVRTNRLWRSVTKRRRELYVFLENMKHRSEDIASGKIG